ncbi:DUF5685 family protein [Clostridium sp. HMP27]|uniref:DUF5685 family protein n=1 Tax=Clostridium sp. HMP27 TaxID=1487921 RepID=UPI00052C48EA|nr:DUF5685 family protein [Clostridium sp. HMP27]KGK90733.1 hypothetical protein DP68_00655 [Clostridium sp. HMP27]
MFGYVTPCKMELKIKDFEKFKAYYCGLCKAIKNNCGNIPRMSLNYDMTFLGILLDSLKEDTIISTREHCVVHPVQKKLFIIDNDALNYAAYCNVMLFYFKLLDNVQDDKSIKSKLSSVMLKYYLKKYFNNYKEITDFTRDKLQELYNVEKSAQKHTLDSLCHPFGELTAYLLSYTITDKVIKKHMQEFGYNLGKWIYVIDAFDDLQKDMENNKFNAISSVLNTDNLDYERFKEAIEARIEFTLLSCGRTCTYLLDKLPIKRNYDLLYNILQLGMIEKINKVFKRSVFENEKSL